MNSRAWMAIAASASIGLIVGLVLRVTDAGLLVTWTVLLLSAVTVGRILAKWVMHRPEALATLEAGIKNRPAP